MRKAYDLRLQLRCRKGLSWRLLFIDIINTQLNTVQMIDEKNEQKQQANTSKQQFKKVQNYVFSYEWKLGSGSFSQVFKGVDTSRNNATVAIKVIKMNSITSKIALTLLQQEVAILKQLDHDNVIRCYDVLHSSNNCYIVTEFCQYGDLEKLLKMKNKFTEDEISPYVYHIFNGLKYLAQKTIIHRDFKVANVFVGDNGVCKIADFGFAKKSNEVFTDICLGSPIYMTPQAIIEKKYGPKTDVWAFGVAIYELISGKAPLSGIKSQQQLMTKIYLPAPHIKQSISAELRNFLDQCLTFKQQHRISVAQMESHQYIRKVITQNEGTKLYASMSSKSQMSDTNTKHTSKTSRLIFKALKNPLSYEQAVSLLQYCRLLSKVCQCIKSPILQQWLLKIIHDLSKTKLKQGQNIDYNQYRETVSNYHTRYYKEFKDRGLRIGIDEVINQCKELLEKEKKYKPQIIAIGSETTLLQESLGHPLRLIHFAKTSNAARYMAS